ncbi:hypothetical protein ACFQV8_02210 [Pseudonocardia benzenivorans]
MLARASREVETTVRNGRITSTTRAKFQAVALLLREERARVRSDADSSEAKRSEQLKRLEGIATILATTAVRDAALMALLDEDAVVSDDARLLKRDLLTSAGIEPPPRRSARPSPPRWRTRTASCRSRWCPASSPTPSSHPTSPRPARPRPARRGWPRGSCSTRCCGRSSGPRPARRHA